MDYITIELSKECSGCTGQFDLTEADEEIILRPNGEGSYMQLCYACYRERLDLVEEF